MEFIDLKVQFKTYEIDIRKRIDKVLQHGQYIFGPEVEELESKLANFAGIRYAATVASGTDALQLSLMALGISHGDEVITVPMTWISTAEVICILGAKPVFVDIDPSTYLMDVNKLEAAITPKTRAIIPVSLFGQIPQMETINKLADKYSLAVIEDGAQSFGATRDGKRSTSLTHVGITSFFPSKPLGCYGDGGAIFTQDESLYRKIIMLRSHGGTRDNYNYPYVGMNSRLDSLQAAILLAKLPHFEKEIKLREEKALIYTESLKDYCLTPKILQGNTHVYAQYTINVSTNRDELFSVLKSNKVPSAIYYPKCLHEHLPYYQVYGSFPQSERISKEVLSIPMHPWLSQQDQNKIIKLVKENLIKLDKVR